MNRRRQDEIEDGRTRALSYLIAGSIGFVIGILTCDDAQAREWQSDIWIEYHDDGALITDSNVEPMLEYAAWSITERAQKETLYIGKSDFAGSMESMRITVKWSSYEQMQDIGASMFAIATTQSWWYESGNMAGAIVHLNRSANISGGECLAHTITHEILHAAGYAGHSDDPHDVMYASQTHCRSALTVDDVRGLPYGESTCWTELMPNNDLYVPYVDGMAALLELTGSQNWALDQYVGSDGDCSSVEVLPGADLVLSDVRGQGVSYYVELENAGGDTWELWYAE